MDTLDTKLFPEQIISYRKQLVIEGLVTELNPNEEDSLIEITPKGYKAIQIYGNYINYVRAKQQEVSLSQKHQKIQQRYLKLKVISIIVTIILSIVSFIAGILLSTPIRNILQ